MKKIIWLIIYFAVLIWSVFQPHDYFTWFLEVFPALIGLAILAVTYKRFQFTELAYWLILIHCIILMVGGHYTYAEVPLFDRIKDLMGSDRNNYDKVGHLAQGFIPAIVARELFIRRKVINGEKWLFFVVVCVCLAISAFYELIEWWVAEFSGESAEAFLGMQGYAWDTQSDMMLAMVGAIIALLILGKIHSRQIIALDSK